jgi:prophage regulatory protein
MVCEMLGVSRSTLWRMQRRKAFPAPTKITERRIAWRRDEVERWLDQRSCQSAVRGQDNRKPCDP